MPKKYEERSRLLLITFRLVRPVHPSFPSHHNKKFSRSQKGEKPACKLKV